MKPIVPVFLGSVLALAAAQACAESRSVLILIKHTKDNKSQVTIRSDEKKERREAVPIEEACAVIKKIEGWGSLVYVFVVSEQRLAPTDVKKLLEAITENAWLELTYVRQGRPKSFVDHYLKTQSVEQSSTSAKP